MATNTLFDGDAYWNDSWVQELDGDEERLYHFYITSPNLDKSGVYKQTERSVEFYVRGLGIERIREITEKFTKAKKVIRCGEWIIVPSSLKHQNYKNLPKVTRSISEYLEKLPDEVFEALRECSYPLDLNAIRPPKEEKTDSLPIDYAMSMDSLSQKTDSLSKYKGEFNSIQLNLIKSNLKEFNVNESNGYQKSPCCGKPVNNSKDESTTKFLSVQKEAKITGYFLTERQAADFLVMDSSWLSGNHNFFVFAAKKIIDDPIYSKKPKAEQERIFAKGWKYDNWIQEYPDWLVLQIEKDKKNALEKLKNTPPKHCVKCGIELEGRICPKCKGRVLFDEEQQDWKYQEYFDVSIGFRENQKRLRGGQELDETPEKPQEENVDDIEF